MLEELPTLDTDVKVCTSEPPVDRHFLEELIAGNVCEGERDLAYRLMGQYYSWRIEYANLLESMQTSKPR